MTNKYQEALNGIKQVHQKPSKNLKGNFETLQELIDKYTLLKKKYKRACQYLEIYDCDKPEENVYTSKQWDKLIEKEVADNCEAKYYKKHNKKVSKKIKFA